MIDHSPPQVKLVLILDQPAPGSPGIFLGLAGLPPVPVLCTGDGDRLPGRHFPDQVAEFNASDPRPLRWLHIIRRHLVYIGFDSPDWIGLELARRALARRLGLLNDGQDAIARLRPITRPVRRFSKEMLHDIAVNPDARD